MKKIIIIAGPNGAGKTTFAHGCNFALETTLSGLGYGRQIPQWRAAGVLMSEGNL